MDICQRNVERNACNIEARGSVLIRHLNWHTPFEVSPGNTSLLHVKLNGFYLDLLVEVNFQWQLSDMKQLEDTKYILAADGTYINKQEAHLR